MSSPILVIFYTLVTGKDAGELYKKLDQCKEPTKLQLHQGMLCIAATPRREGCPGDSATRPAQSHAAKS